MAKKPEDIAVEPLLIEGPFDGATAIPDGATKNSAGTELNVPTASGVAVYQRYGAGWRWARNEPVYR